MADGVGGCAAPHCEFLLAARSWSLDGRWRRLRLRPIAVTVSVLTRC